MPLTRLALLLAYILISAGLSVFIIAQLSPQGDAAALSAMLLPLAMLAGLCIRALHKRLEKDDN